MGEMAKNWHKTLDQVLRACRTSPKEAMNTTPFRLTYGHEVVLLVEIYLQFTRIQRQGEIPSDHYWNMMLDEMVDLAELLVAIVEICRACCEKKVFFVCKRLKEKGA